MEHSIKKELMLKILDDLDKNNNLLKLDELNIDKEQYGQILEIMSESGLISGVKVNEVGSNKEYQIIEIHPKITLNGIEYLDLCNRKNNNQLIDAINNIAHKIESLNRIIH